MKYKEKPQLPTTLHQAHRIIRMITREGFCELFEEELNNVNTEGYNFTQEEIFNHLNHEYYIVVGATRYSEYKVFLRRRCFIFKK